jgi:hypothetical protein
MFYVLAFLGWAVFDAYSGFTLFVLWMCHSLCTPDVPRKNKSDSPNAPGQSRPASGRTLDRVVGGSASERQG